MWTTFSVKEKKTQKILLKGNLESSPANSTLSNKIHLKHSNQREYSKISSTTLTTESSFHFLSLLSFLFFLSFLSSSYSYVRWRLYNNGRRSISKPKLTEEHQIRILNFVTNCLHYVIENMSGFEVMNCSCCWKKVLRLFPLDYFGYIRAVGIKTSFVMLS